MRIFSVLSLFLILFVSHVTGQIIEPVKWTYSFKATSANEGEVIARCSIEDSWHVYALTVSDDPNFIGPMPTVLRLIDSPDFERIGGVIQGKYIKHHDPVFEAELMYFEKTAEFKQKIRLKNTAGFTLKGELEYQACDEEKCIFPAPEPFTVKVPPVSETGVPADTIQTATEEADGIKNPVSWNFSTISRGNNQYTVRIKATVAPGWHTYSIVPTEAGGPAPTEISFRDSTAITFNGPLRESATIKKYDKMFMTDVMFFSDSAVFEQDITITDPTVNSIKGSVKGMACNDESCVPVPPVYFMIDLLTGNGVEISPEQANTESGPAKFRYQIPGLNFEQPYKTDCGTVVTGAKKGDSLWTIFFLGFIGGLIALLTPCVFPMIPLTVSFFTKGSGSRRQGMIRAITYGSFIFIIYLLLSLPFHLLDSVDENILNNISTNVTLNIIFFVIFIVFAISFFGYFEITLPSSIANRADSASNVGGLAGSFFMALTLAIVSFSCTGPILGSLLASSLSKDGGAIQLTAGMGGFGAALGIPFSVFAAFPSMLKSLPKSGGWLNTVKVVLGFLEVALALKFLSNADMVAHWDFLKYELFMGLWVIIFLLMAVYLFGKIKFPHDSPIKKLSRFRLGFAIAILIWTGYLATGFRFNEKSGTYHSLSALSGLAPPPGYSWIYPIHCPHNLDCEHDYLAGLERARKEGKPLFLDFTGYACVNCRKMEENVWIEPQILDKLKNDVIVVSLYVDDKKELPAELQEIYTSAKTGKTREIKTYGDRWATFQIETFVNNSQPWYVMLSPDEQLLTHPVGYTPKVEEYEKWLNCGIDAYKELQAKGK
ncbi:MAG: hypothetical protein RL220_1242 [Bacteroidota bacterium]